MDNDDAARILREIGEYELADLTDPDGREATAIAKARDRESPGYDEAQRTHLPGWWSVNEDAGWNDDDRFDDWDAGLD